MDNDIFYNPTKVIFGRNTELLVGDEVAKYGDKVLLHYGGGSAERSGLLDRGRKSLKASDITVYELGGVKSNPRCPRHSAAIPCRQDVYKRQPKRISG